MNYIDLRSDTITQPTALMRESIFQAKVGDDVYEEDPSVKELEEFAADMMGHEQALFFPTGTQSNLAALLSHCDRGEEYITGQQSHIYKYEAGGGAVLGSIQPQPIEIEENGELSIERMQTFIKQDDFHFAKTKLVSIENTIRGNALTLDYMKQVQHFTKKNRLKYHIDGARIFNAAIKYKIDVKEYAQIADSISCCLSKNLGAPAGTVLCADRDFIAKARRWRKMLGGGMRQAGFIAAAGLYALKNHIQRLEEDHQNADYLAQALKDNPLFTVDLNEQRTNMVLVDCPEINIDAFSNYLLENGVKILKSKQPLRLVLHLNVSEEDVKKVARLMNSYVQA